MARFTAFIAATLMSVVCDAHAGSAGMALATTDGLQSEIACAGGASIAPKAAVLEAMSQLKISSSSRQSNEMMSLLSRSGLPSSGYSGLSTDAKASIDAESALALSGFVVSAKMVHDDSASIRDYKTSKISQSIARYLATSVEAVRDSDDESKSIGSQTAATAHAHDAGLEEIGSALDVVLKRVATVKAGLGPFYAIPEVRYYILGHAFRDPVAVISAARLVCLKKLSPPQLKAIGMGADFVRGRRVATPKVGSPK